MNFRRGTQREEPEINFIPLVDLLLVILIFLMVTTTYARHGELQLNLPSAAGAPQEQRPAEILVAVARDGRVAIGDAPASTRDAARLSADLATAAQGLSEPRVIVQADAGATHQSVIGVLEAARLAGLARVSFATQTGAR